jgi:hypothetical protein
MLDKRLIDLGADVRSKTQQADFRVAFRSIGNFGLVQRQQIHSRYTVLQLLHLIRILKQ